MPGWLLLSRLLSFLLRLYSKFCIWLVFILKIHNEIPKRTAKAHPGSYCLFSRICIILNSSSPFPVRSLILTPIPLASPAEWGSDALGSCPSAVPGMAGTDETAPLVGGGAPRREVQQLMLDQGVHHLVVDILKRSAPFPHTRTPFHCGPQHHTSVNGAGSQGGGEVYVKVSHRPLRGALIRFKVIGNPVEQGGVRYQGISYPLSSSVSSGRSCFRKDDPSCGRSCFLPNATLAKFVFVCVLAGRSARRRIPAAAWSWQTCTCRTTGRCTRAASCATGCCGRWCAGRPRLPWSSRSTSPSCRGTSVCAPRPCFERELPRSYFVIFKLNFYLTPGQKSFGIL